MWVGLTGNIGTGKSTVVNLLKQYEDVLVHDSDSLAKKAINIPAGQEFIKNRFGEQYIVDGNVDYQSLGNLVFSNPDDLKDLEAYSHPIVVDWLQKNYKASKINVVENALLFENGWDSWCEVVLYVTCHPLGYRQRLYDRGMTDEDINKRLKLQLTIAPTVKVKKSIQIDNTLGIDVLEQRVSKIIDDLRQKKGLI